jgi:thiol-disulfide isomerase/thioredoxin
MEPQPSRADTSPKFWRRLRGWLPELVVFVVVIAGVHLYRTQDMLNASGEPAPDLYLPSLVGSQSGLPPPPDRTTLVYFFAPWCTWCAASAHNIRKLRDIRGEEELTVFLVALSYETVEEVEAYVERHELDVPVLLGTRNTAVDWGVRAFPTYYIVDSDRRVVHRDYGYSSLAGLWLRTVLAD